MRSAVVLAADDGAAVERAVDRLAPTVDEVVVSCRRREQFDAGTYRLAVDPVPGGGHVAAIRSGCRVARGSAAFVTTPDSEVEPEFVTGLFEAHDADAVVPRIDGRRRPLTAVYDTDAAVEAADVTLGMGSSSVTDLLDRLAVRVVAEPVSAD